MTYLKLLIDYFDFPTAVLSFMLVGIAYAMSQAQKKPGFDWGDGFRDGNGKVSYTHAAVPIALALSSWVLLYVTINGIKSTFSGQEMSQVLQSLLYWYIAYMVVWAGTKTVDKLVELAQTYLNTKSGRQQDREQEGERHDGH